MTPIQRARELVADALGLELSEVPEDGTMESVEAWDSLQHLSVITAIEADFAITLSPEQVASLQSVSAIGALIAEHGES